MSTNTVYQGAPEDVSEGNEEASFKASSGDYIGSRGHNLSGISKFA